MHKKQRTAYRGQRTEKGVLITLEGPEGSGKSTHGRLLASWLRKRGFRVLFTREPGGTPFGQKLRKLLLKGDSLDPFMELCLFEAARRRLVDAILRPALRRGTICVLDRFQDSTWVYQGWAGGLSLPLVEAMGRLATGGLVPDVTILLDLPVGTGLGRVKRPNRMEGKAVSFHRKVRRGYLILARRERQRIRVVKSSANPLKVQESIRRIIGDVLEKRCRA